jgi:hypothetical protein
MKKLVWLAAAAAASASLAATAASAATTVVNFDDLTGIGQVPNGYAGIIWNDNWSYYDYAQSPYTPSSGSTRIYNLTSALVRPQFASFDFTTPVRFDGAMLAGNPITSVSFHLYLGGVLVHDGAAQAPTATPTFLSSGYAGPVDKVVVEDDDPTRFYDWYVLDDVTFSSVPEPATWAMMLFGFGALGALLRTRRRAAAA